MMSSTAMVVKHQSWIPPNITWRELPHAQIVVVPAQDHNLVEFLVEGSRLVHTGGSREQAALRAGWMGLDTLAGQLQRYVANAVTPVISAGQKSLPSELSVYCLGAWRLPVENELAILVSLDKPAMWSFPLELELKIALEELRAEFLQRVADWEAEKAGKEARLQELCDANPQYKEAFDKGRLFGLAEEESQRPKVALGTFVSIFPCAALFNAPPSKSAKSLQSVALQAIAASGFLPSRDGQFSGITAGAKPVRCGLVTWQPHLGLPSYPEIRWAVQRVLPRALARPRYSHVGRPEFESTPDEATICVELPREIAEWTEIFSGTSLEEADFAKRIDQSRQQRLADGFEAIAWFQPYHAWTEETWGIYLDAKRLDDFALSIWADCRDHSFHINSDLANILAFGLIVTHEMFHARVEAASSWLELNHRLPRFSRYQEDVYRALSGYAFGEGRGLSGLVLIVC